MDARDSRYLDSTFRVLKPVTQVRQELRYRVTAVKEHLEGEHADLAPDERLGASVERDQVSVEQGSELFVADTSEAASCSTHGERIDSHFFEFLSVHIW